jgi:D-glycero-D-manno-heptose 1,7-bisphosphate phosphatase
MTRRAVFIDRDGTLSEEVGYVNHIDRLRLIDGSASAIRRLNEAGLQTVLVTNQAGVARGYFDEQMVADVHERLRALLIEHGARLDGIYYCPHHPDVGVPPYRQDCECRKPGPGMLLRAQEEMGIDLASSYIVGDSFKDLRAGAAVGAIPILVLTGYGKGQYEHQSADWPFRPRFVAADLVQAVDWILQREAED